MSTNLDANGMTLTPEEAKEVFELWAKRQTDTESLRSRLSVHEMAEAMSISPVEVEGMLASVRAQHATPVVLSPLKQVRPVNTFLIALCATAWIAIITAAGISASEVGSSVPPPVAEVVYEAPPVQELSELGRDFSSRLSVEFDNTKVKGLADPGGTLATDTLRQVVDNIWPAPTAMIPNLVSDANIIKVLREDAVTEATSNLIAFKKMFIRTQDAVVTATIPVSLTGDWRVRRLVSQEQERRLRILANDAAQQLQF